MAVSAFFGAPVMGTTRERRPFGATISPPHCPRPQLLGDPMFGDVRGNVQLGPDRSAREVDGVAAVAGGPRRPEGTETLAGQPADTSWSKRSADEEKRATSP
jgi:hypothetical protein